MCFFFNDPATTEIYTLSLHDALPICFYVILAALVVLQFSVRGRLGGDRVAPDFLLLALLIYTIRSEEHTSELQSLRHLVCRLLLEKKKKKSNYDSITYNITI